MRYRFTAIVSKAGSMYFADCPEIPDATGLGHSKREAKEALAESIVLCLENRIDSAVRKMSPDDRKETVAVQTYKDEI